MTFSLRDEIKKGCPDCPWKGRKSCTVLPEGPETSPLMVIGRNPGYMEDLTGRPFVGPAGKSLGRFLHDSGVDRGKVYITNTGKCYGGPGDPCPTDEVFDICETFLLREIALVKPKLIIPCGFDAYRRVTRDTSPISVVQGKVVEFRHIQGQLFFPLTHPSFWVRTKGYYGRVVFQDVIPEFQRVLLDLGIMNRLNQGLEL